MTDLELMKLTLRWINNNAEHNQHCSVFDLDEDGNHQPCSCGLLSVITALSERLTQQVFLLRNDKE